MDFGKLQNIENVDFTLPPDNISNSKILNGTRAAQIKVYAGCPVWSDKSWVGKIYPDKAQEKDFLRYYGQQFNCIELNATHYKIPGPATVERWTNSVGPDFRFCPKVPQVISHANNLNEMAGLMAEFIETLLCFGTKLGTTFLQLPPHFKTDRLAELTAFISIIPHPIKLSVELRHESWFAGTKAFEELSALLMECDHSLVITDVSGRRDVVHQRLTNKNTFIRFGANDLHPTDFKRMDDWTNRLSSWIDKGLEELYFFMHTPEKSLCPEQLNYFIGQLNKKAGTELPVARIKQISKQGDLFS